MEKRAIKPPGAAPKDRSRKDLRLEHLAEPQQGAVQFFIQVTAKRYQQLEEFAAEGDKSVAEGLNELIENVEWLGEQRAKGPVVLPAFFHSREKKPSGGPGTALNVVIPSETLLAVKTRAVMEGSTVRAVILAALHRAGHPVPAHELTDRRRKG